MTEVLLASGLSHRTEPGTFKIALMSQKTFPGEGCSANRASLKFKPKPNFLSVANIVTSRFAVTNLLAVKVVLP